MDSAITTFWYIYQNPVKSGLVKNIQDWEYSSYKEYSGLRSERLSNVDLGKSIFDLSIFDFENEDIAEFHENDLEGIF